MKRSEMEALAASLCAYLTSRNHDIAGWWGIGRLCDIATRNRKHAFSFKVRPGEVLWIYGYEVSGSRRITDRLVKHGLSSIEGRITFLPAGRYSNGLKRFYCSVAIAVTQDGRTGLALRHVECWPHDSFHESRRGGGVT